MHDSDASKPHPLIATALAAGALLLVLLPAAWTEPLRSTVRDVARPGLVVVDATSRVTADVRDHLLDRTDLERRIRELEQELATSDQSRRAAELALSEWRTRADSEDSPPLVGYEVVVGRVLGREAEDEWRAGLFADVGANENLHEEAHVLTADGPIVDRGRDGDLEAGETVVAGRVVVGRLRAVGRWTSVVQPVTSGDYRVRARIAHRTERGLVFGPTGILRGTDAEHCRLDFVGSTEAVEEGDEVYTMPDDGGLAESTPLLLGRVSSAELPSGVPHWEIEVAPAAPERPERVAILRRRFNPLRTLAN